MVENFNSSFSFQGSGELAWRLTFDGKHYFAEFADQIININLSLRHFLDDVRAGNGAHLEIDDEGAFFNIDVTPIKDETGIVKIVIQEARGGRQTEVTMGAASFVDTVTKSINSIINQFQGTSYLVDSVLEHYDK